MNSAEYQPFYDLVVVGSSAGGIEALLRLVATLPASFPAPVVLAQHLDPHRASRLSEILARRTIHPIHQLEDGPALALQPATIYVPPAARDVEIVAGGVQLKRTGDERRAMPSIDLLLSSAAHIHGERTIAVILTGTGSDAADGAREISAAGGMVIIENPQTAAYPSLPASLSPATVDLVVDLDRIGPLVYDLLSGTYAVPTTATPQPDESLDTLLEIVQAHTGLDFSRYKAGTISRRIQRRMAAAGILTLRDYTRYVSINPDECDRLAASFLVNVTEFFRDPPFFTFLREEVLPDLLTYSRAHGNRLRIWSSGCSTGEEAYSLAMLIADQLGAELPRFTVHIFATDADPEAIAFARRGIYPAAAVASVPDTFKARYFARVDGSYIVDRRIRGLVVFGEHDLGKRAPFPEMDLVLCRNVLIYFTPALQRRALELFAFSLRDQGYLALGTSETASALPNYFAPAHPRLRVYRRQGGRVFISPLPARSSHFLAPPPLLGQPASLLRLGMLSAPREPPKLEPSPPAPSIKQRGDEVVASARAKTSLEQLGEQILSLSAGVVVVDQQYDVKAINNAAYELLDILHAAHEKDLLHLAERAPTKPLRAAIDAALRSGPLEQRQVTLELTLSDGVTRRLHITCYPHHSETRDHSGARTVDAVALFITDVTGEPPRTAETTPPESDAGAKKPAGAQRPRSRKAVTGAGAEDALRQSLEEAQATIRELRAANQSMRDAYEEQVRGNDELMVRQEEAQATNEQARTLNEELQATNEELETLNEQMEATLEQLHTTNDDLQSRAQELEDLVMEREAQRQDSDRERASLAAILASLNDAMLVVDASGAPLLTNAAYDELFGSANEPARLEDLTGQPLPAEATPQRRALESQPFTMEFVLVSAQGERRVLEARGQPIGGESGTLGGVVTFREITDPGARVDPASHTSTADR